VATIDFGFKSRDKFLFAPLPPFAVDVEVSPPNCDNHPWFSTSPVVVVVVVFRLFFFGLGLRAPKISSEVNLLRSLGGLPGTVAFATSGPSSDPSSSILRNSSKLASASGDDISENFSI
jgi:hypothetical protein